MTTNNAKGAADGDEKYKNASYYGEDIFDDLIAEALDSSQHGDAGPERSTAEPRVVDITPSKKSRRRRSVDDDGDDDDAASLDSEEISGGSDVSEVEKERNMYAPPPLINDDESTVDMRPPAPQSQTVSSYVDQLNRTERSKGRLIRAGAFAIVIAIVVGVILAVVSLGGGRKDGGGSSSVQASTPRGPPVTQTASTVATTLVPTAGPVILTPIETIHPLKLTFQNIPAGYRLPEDHRASIIGYIGELLEDYLSGEFELLEVAYARQGGGGGNQRTIIGGSPPSRALRTSQPSQRRRLLSFALPLRIVLRGPPTFSEDFVRSYLVEEMNDQSTYIGNYLKAFDWETYKNVRISAEIYDFADLIEPTMSPSLPPQTRSPSLSPSMRPQTRTPTTSPLLSPETRSPTVSPSRSPNVAKLLITKPPTTRSPVVVVTLPTMPVLHVVPVTPEPTREPTRRPTRWPTPRPTRTPRPTPTSRPSFRPTRRPTPRPTARPTLATRRPTNRPTPSPTPRPVLSFPVAPSVPSSGSNGYFCAKKSYTADWNILLEWGKCEMPCPSMSHSDCPGGHECRPPPEGSCDWT